MAFDQPYHLTNNPPGTVVVDADQLEANFNYIMGLLNGAGSLPITQAGALQMIAHDTADPGWLLCDGAAVSRSTYAALFAKIGTKYGAGDGSTTFNLPDMRGRMPVGKGTHADVDTLGKADAAAVGSRKPKHSHNAAGATASTAGSHSHGGSTQTENVVHQHGTGEFSNYLTDGGSTFRAIVQNITGPDNFGIYSKATSGDENAAHSHPINADGNHTHAVTGNVGDTGGPAESPAYQVVNFQVKV